MNENEKAYRKMDSFYQEEKKGGNNLVRTIFVPFMSGILGSTLVVGTCFGVPSIKESLLGTSTITASSQTTNEKENVVNTNFISLSNYSDTSVAVAQKVLPSIVGIEIKSNITSIFGTSGTSTGSGSRNNY